MARTNSPPGIWARHFKLEQRRPRGAIFAGLADLAGGIRLLSLKTTIKIWLYRLIGLNPRTERWLDVYLTRRMYRRVFGREPDLANPVLFSEKITARKLFERRPIFTTISDKVLVRDFVTDRIGAQFLTKLHFVGERFEQIDFDRLPDEFVIKANHGCRWMSIVEDKKAFDRNAAREQFRRWLRDSYHLYSREYMYKNIERRILVEELLKESSGAPAIDYKFYVYDSVVRFVLVTRRVGEARILAFFDRDGRSHEVRGVSLSSAHRARPLSSQPGLAPTQFPANFEQMAAIASELGRGFDFMRVDLYNPGERILFGEMTPLPTGGVVAYDPPDFDRTLGEPWRLALNGRPA